MKFSFTLTCGVGAINIRGGVVKFLPAMPKYFAKQKKKHACERKQALEKTVITIQYTMPTTALVQEVH